MQCLARPAADNAGKRGPEQDRTLGAVGESLVDPLLGIELRPPPSPHAQPSPLSPCTTAWPAKGCSQPGIQHSNWLIVLREHSRGCNPTRSLARGQGLLGESSLAAECLPQPDAWVLTGAGSGIWAPVKPFFPARPRMINEVEGQGDTSFLLQVPSQCLHPAGPCS